MKFSLIQIIIVIGVASHMRSVQGYDALKVVLNWGYDHYCLDRWGNCCETWEWNLISDRFYQMAGNQRRALRSNNNNKTDVIVAAAAEPINITSTKERDLADGVCAYQCRGFAPGRCLAARCRSYRRRGLLDSVLSTVTQKSDNNENDRNLYWATNCENQKSEFNNLFNNLKYQVGARCRSLLEAPREMSCLYNVDC